MPERPRVFVSSIMEGYDEFRGAARRGIERAGGMPVLVEDQPAGSSSPRTACLDLVASSDVVLSVIGDRGGYRAPSGRLVVREEFDEAQARSKPTVVLLQDVERDTDGQQLAGELSDWVAGRLRRTFRSPEELEHEVERALKPLLQTMNRTPQDPLVVQSMVEDDRHGGGRYETVLRLGFAPTVAEEVIDPLTFDDEKFRRKILSEAHESELLDYRYPKEPRSTSDGLTIEQRSERGRDGYAEIVILSSGVVGVSVQVTGQSEGEGPFGRGHFSSQFEIVRSDLEVACSAAFDFVNRLLAAVDPHQRHGSWIYSVGLVNSGMRRIVDEPARSNEAYSMGLGEVAVVTAFDSPRRINRIALARPDEEIRRIGTLLQKRLDEAKSPY